MCALLTYIIIKSTLVVFMSWPRKKEGGESITNISFFRTKVRKKKKKEETKQKE